MRDEKERRLLNHMVEKGFASIHAGDTYISPRLTYDYLVRQGGLSQQFHHLWITDHTHLSFHLELSLTRSFLVQDGI